MSNQIYASQDLQNRSFIGKDLTGVDFSGADLRGCDFTRAILVGANFDRVITGQSQRHIPISILSVIIAAIALVAFSFMLEKIDSLLFDSFGDLYRKIVNVLLPIVLILLLFLRDTILEKFPRITNFLGDASFGIFVVMTVLLTLGLGFISFTGTFLFLIPTLISAIISFYVFQWFIESIKKKIGTSFKKANLTDANFSQAIVKNTDFSFALLSGICINGWQLDSHTLFTGAKCDYLYLKPQQQQSYPLNSNFQTQEFKDFLKQFTEIDSNQ
ncbi:pentapeptide repeat-containing protein [Tumidithrix elongata RA019]|uniref:Pentapeptide repeat-containing protein n=1 Tax=Tumidithrix elongata BACA0141 TaxID=2716417 RepID=A0AAW9Q3R0_9CYAN|nr:pentapeptide repeat-containing protein [Tumidithrix elongata RA019]